MRQDDRRPEPTDPDQQLNRQQRRAARFRPLAGKPDPHAVMEPAAIEPAADEAATDDAAPDEAAPAEGASAAAAAEAAGDEPAATPA